MNKSEPLIVLFEVLGSASERLCSGPTHRSLGVGHYKGRHVIEELATKISPALLERSGRVFYSGRSAFAEQADLYVIGFNPGGDPVSEAETTVRHHTDFVLHVAPTLWSAYSDERWKGRPPGSFGMQPRMLHLFKQLGRGPRRTPCSNLIFVRSRRAEGLSDNPDQLEELCWPFHFEVMRQLKPRIVICLGNDTGNRVRRRLGANEIIETFVETNHRKWTSRAYRSSSGLVVLSLTHPSIADWTNSLTDPSSLVLKFLGHK